jgi:hypothetical protein
VIRQEPRLIRSGLFVNGAGQWPAGIRRRLWVAGQLALATMQAVLAGLVAPGLLVFRRFGQDTPSKEAYNDGRYTATVEERFTFVANGLCPPNAELYRTRLGLSDE